MSSHTTNILKARRVNKQLWQKERKRLGNQLRSIRDEQQMPNKVLALRTGLTQPNLSQLLSGRRAGLSFELIDFVANQLGWRLVVKLERD